MDMDDGLYGVAVGLAILVMFTAQFFGVFIISFAFLAGQRLRCYLAIVVLIILAGSHLAIAFEPGMWGKVFVGSELPIDQKWRAAGYNHSQSVPWIFLCLCVTAHAYILVLSLKFISGCDSVKAALHRMVPDEV